MTEQICPNKGEEIRAGLEPYDPPYTYLTAVLLWAEPVMVFGVLLNEMVIKPWRKGGKKNGE